MRPKDQNADLADNFRHNLSQAVPAEPVMRLTNNDSLDECMVPVGGSDHASPTGVFNMHPFTIRLRANLPKPSSRYYLSHDGARPLGPFPMNEVNWMIRCRHFSREVLIRMEGDEVWTSYRHYTTRSILGSFLCGVISQLDRAGILAAADVVLRRVRQFLPAKNTAYSRNS
jgi:hypothetical protein